MAPPRATDDLIVVGGGLAGLSAADHARALGLSVTILEGELPGGLVANVGAVEGLPGGEAAGGAEYAYRLLDRAMNAGAAYHPGHVESLTLEEGRKIVMAGAERFVSKHVILATGARLRQLGVPGEERLAGRGVSQCAFCDAGFFQAEDVVVVGGGDAALQEAMHLAEGCRTITLVHRGNRLRAKPAYVARAADEPKFQFRWEARVAEIQGSETVEGVRLANADGETVDELACTGVFVFIGSRPNADLAPAEAMRDDEGALIVDAGLQTRVPGLYAAGALRAGDGGQLVQAMADGITAAQSAARAINP